ncbi:MAG: MFS transporter [Candidatus Latescibacteria bacterium]|nr:MFS transporter [Candidatus Latescibacterota bacterium]
MPNNKAALIIAISALTVAIAMGVRQSFGLFLQPVTQTLGMGRESFSLAIALQNILFGLPLAGILADRFGPRWVVAGGAALYALGFALFSMAQSSWMVYLSLGVMVGLALSATTYVVLLGAVGRVVPAEKRSTSFGLITAAGSFGTFAVVPLIQWLIDAISWQTTLLYAAVIVGIMALLALGFPTAPKEAEESSPTDPNETFTHVWGRARKHSGYLLINAGFFVCGFHVAFIATHLPSYLADYGLSKMVAATALALIGLFNMGGSYLFGRLGDHYRKKYLLSFLYLARGVVISGFLIFPVTQLTALVFACAIGFLWLATVPLTSGTVAQIFGSRHLSSLYGIVFLSHQVGSFLGVWLGGRLYDSTGSYDGVWMAAIALSVFAALVHLPIKDQALARARPVSG